MIFKCFFVAVIFFGLYLFCMCLISSTRETCERPVDFFLAMILAWIKVWCVSWPFRCSTRAISWHSVVYAHKEFFADSVVFSVYSGCVSFSCGYFAGAISWYSCVCARIILQRFCFLWCLIVCSSQWNKKMCKAFYVRTLLWQRRTIENIGDTAQFAEAVS